MSFLLLSHDRVTYDVDRDVSTAILLVFIRKMSASLHRRILLYLVSSYIITPESNIKVTRIKEIISS